MRNFHFPARLAGTAVFLFLLAGSGSESRAGNLCPWALPYHLNPVTCDLPEPAPPAFSRLKGGKKISVVIDPGHGGKDWGTIGQDRVLEKDLVLDISRMVFNLLNQDPRFDAALTRDCDRYLSLNLRKKIAQKLEADIFISIHANWGQRVSADGPEVFFLSLQASDKAAMQVAIRENKEIQVEEETLEKFPMLEVILQDLTQTDYLQKSKQLAELIYKELYQALPGEKRGVKQAPFLVLKGIYIPAALIEIGFLSNPDDCYLLNTEYGKQIVAKSITSGIKKFGRILARK